MNPDTESQIEKIVRTVVQSVPRAQSRGDLITPNPKLKLLDQVRDVMRLKHYSIGTERSYCDWIRRYVQFHQMHSREDLFPGEAKVEACLSDLACCGRAAAG